MRQAKKGFTLLEVMMVLSIITVLASIILPVLARAKRQAKRAVSTSNLHQCWLSLRMYCDDYGGERAMPNADAATQLLATAPTCDPNDTWRQSCSESFGPPLIGSYGYVRSSYSCSTQDGWNWLLGLKRNPILLVSIYYADKVPDAFHGEGPGLSAGIHNYYMPDHVLRLRLDGSVRYEPQYSLPATPEGGQQILTWSSLFLLDNPQGYLSN